MKNLKKELVFNNFASFHVESLRAFGIGFILSNITYICDVRTFKALLKMFALSVAVDNRSHAFKNYLIIA